MATAAPEVDRQPRRAEKAAERYRVSARVEARTANRRISSLGARLLRRRGYTMVKTTLKNISTSGAFVAGLICGLGPIVWIGATEPAAAGEMPFNATMFSDVAERVTPAVVNITTKRAQALASTGNPFEG